MKKVAGQIILALVLVGLGGAFWMAGRLEGRVADAHEELALLRYTALDAEYGDIDQAMTYVRRVPWVADAWSTTSRSTAPRPSTGRRATTRSRRSATPPARSSSSSRRCWRWRPTPRTVPVSAKAAIGRRCCAGSIRRSRATPSC